MNNKFSVVVAFILLSSAVAFYFYQTNSATVVEGGVKESIEQGTETSLGNVYERNYSPSFGPDDAKVTIVEFFDPACGACGAFYPFVKQILSRHPNDVRVVLRYVPFHRGADEVIRLIEAARAQGKFEPFLALLMERQADWVANHTADVYLAMILAKEIGVDVEAAKAYMQSEQVSALLQQELADLAELKVSKTPTFFVNEQPLPSFGAEQLYGLVVSELNKN